MAATSGRRTSGIARGTLGLAVVATLGLTAGCGGADSSSSGGTLRLGTSTEIDSLNPFVAINQPGYATFELIYPQLVQYDDKLAFAPDFATKWTTSQGGKVWTFTTQKGAKWSDGKPMTAADAAWTFSTILKFSDTVASNQSSTLNHLVSAKAPDDTTLVLTYDKPVANVLSNLQQLPVLPQHVWAQYATGKGKELKSFDNLPSAGKPVVSGGPFMLTSYKKDQIVLYKDNPNWYGTKPKMDGFGLQYFSNEDAMVTALKSHAIDAVSGLPVTAVDTVKKAGMTVNVAPGMEFHDWIFNSNPKKPKNRELLDPTVREAFESAIDRDQIDKTAWLGYASAGTSIIPPASGGGWTDTSLSPVPFDLAKANALLDQKGFKKGSDGIRVADGHKMDYQVIMPGEGSSMRAFQIIQSDLAKAGVRIEARKLDSSAAWDAIIAPDGKYLDFDLAMWDWVPLVDPDFMLSVMTCGSYNGWNDSGYCNPAYDKLYDQSTTATDPAQRHQIVNQMQQVLYHDKPYVVLGYNDVIDAYDSSWSGFGHNPQGIFNALTKQGFLEAHKS
ncbi:MAG: ABC transporter substrate-binding protein [Nocardioidaceae bacterium]